jgi:hypothetical protein
MTPTAVGLVLVEGESADGEIMEQDAFDVPTRRGTAAISASEYVAGALSRTRAMAEDHRPQAIAVTWSDDSEQEASLLLKSLTEAGFDNVVAIRSPEASEALARGIGRAVGYDQTAVCLLEPHEVLVSMVDTYDDTIETVVNRTCGDADQLIDWLATVFEHNDWHPECLVLVGQDADLKALALPLEHALALPVVAPAEAELALARGAALASAESGDVTPPRAEGASDDRQPRRKWPLPYLAALAMLAVGGVVFVVSISLVFSMQMTPESPSKPAEQHAPANTPVTQTGQAGPAAPPAISPPPLEIPAPLPEAPVEAAPPEGPSVDSPAEPPVTVSDSSPGVPPGGAAPGAPEEFTPPPVIPPPADMSAAPSQPGSKPPLLTRILQHVPGLHPDPPPPAGSNETPPSGTVPAPDTPPPSP